MKTYLLLLTTICLVMSCAYVHEDIPAPLRQANPINKDLALDKGNIPSLDRVEPREDDCRCNITYNASLNIQASSWQHRYRFLRDPIGTASGSVFFYPTTNYPSTYLIPQSLKTNEIFTHEVIFNYDENPLQKYGFITVTVACNLAPPYIKTFHLPSYAEVGGGTLILEGSGRITKGCGSISADDDSVD